ncbi:interferon-induced very large GTPase 1-like [Mytilus edulis]|uniref:interferon-induced very large GTPase 1-like n=1 Tax=Mytilus edulis TaxID=6550 RepID=UPI0039F13306
MVLQRLLPLGLGGAAVAILYSFDVPYILLVVICLFFIHALSKFWTKKPTVKSKAEDSQNTNTVTKDLSESKKSDNSSCGLTEESVDSDFVENPHDYPYEPNSLLNEENISLQQNSKIPEMTPCEENGTSEYHDGFEDIISYDMILKETHEFKHIPDSTISKVDDLSRIRIDENISIGKENSPTQKNEKDKEEIGNEFSNKQNSLPNNENLKIHEVSPYNENGRQEYHNGVEDTISNDMVKKERDKIKHTLDSAIVKAEDFSSNTIDKEIGIGHETISSNKDKGENKNGRTTLQCAENIQHNSEIPALIPQDENLTDIFQCGAEIKNTTKLLTENDDLKDEDMLKNETSTTHFKIEKIKTDEEEQESKNFRTPIPDDTCRSIAEFLKRIGLETFYPNNLQLMDALKIRTPTTSPELKDIALKFVENIVMVNCNCRDQMLQKLMNNKFNTTDDNRDEEEAMYSVENILNDTEDENETEINPLDILLVLFKCSSPMLKQIISNKLFMCKLAIPFILPTFKNEPIELCVWPFRSIILESKVHKGSIQDMSVECACEIVSFVRIGRPSVSKSKLVNEVLNDQYHNTFSNRDCPLGTSRRKISDGIVEASWYIPSNKLAVLKNITMFLNLRGDALEHNEQLFGVSQITDILVVVLDINSLEDKLFMFFLNDMLNTSKCILLAINAYQNNKNDVKERIKSFTKTIANYRRLVNICILSMDGQMRSSSNTKTEMRKAIAAMMKENVDESVYSRISKCKLKVDEEDIIYRNARQNALDVLKHFPKEISKETVVPLQGANWASWSKKQKNVYKSSQYKSLEELSKIKTEMDEDRQKQVKECENLGPFIKTFLDILSKLISSDTECTVFVLWLKHFLDQRSRSVLPGYLSKYQSDWQALKTKRDNQEDDTVIKRCKEDLTKSELKLDEASFGFEHLCREMGQIFESLNQCKPDHADAINLRKLAETLPFITAKLLVMGQPFEIMDGDVSNIPLCWVRAVLEQLRGILGDKRLLALSVLGIQGSGKSILLNTMFGLQFAVSAGRCTRGVFIQLVPVEIDKSKFDYILVIDTEGLRAPELANQKHSHDNELATFVIGLGDITIVNVKGENATEIKDVLQIVVHAFLRLKLTNEKLNLKKTCVFVHQNVPALDANDRMMQGRRKFVEVLDEMTKEAAEQENIADIQSFNQVINFDSENNVWYFSNLWHGDPPMAPTNPGYSEIVSTVKDTIMHRLTPGRETYLTITDTISRIEDLWNGILKDDFVFSFRNSLELKAYNSMDQQCQTITWKLEKYVLEFIKSEAKSKLVNCENEVALENEVPSIMMHLSKEVDKQVKDLNSEMNSFVNESTLKDIMIQWTQAKQNRFVLLAESLIIKAKSAVNSTKEELRIKIMRVKEKTKHEIEINEMGKQLALEMKGQVPDDSVLTKKFDSLWNSWINKFETNDIRNFVPIKKQIESMLCELFPSDARFLDGFIDENISLPEEKEYQNMTQLYGTLTKNYISTKKHLSIYKWRIGIVWLESTPEQYNHQAIDLTNKIFRKIDIKLGEIVKYDIRFDSSYVTEIFHIVAQEIHDFNLHTTNDYKFNLLPPFRAMI